MKTLRLKECGGVDCIQTYSSAEVGQRQESSSQITVKGYVTITELKLPGTQSRFPWQPYGANHLLWVALIHSLYGFFFFFIKGRYVCLYSSPRPQMDSFMKETGTLSRKAVSRQEMKILAHERPGGGGGVSGLGRVSKMD